ncbi:MAG: hypothetical protein ACR2PW_04580 [Gammaproteobacteria bacterium]
MSYWIYLEDHDGNTLPVEHHSEGGTYVLGGVPEAELNVTYNYSERYSEHGFSLRDLEGKTGAETADQLLNLVAKMGTDLDNDYWKPTSGNAGHALSILAKWAREHPAGIWRVS